MFTPGALLPDCSDRIPAGQCVIQNERQCGCHLFNLMEFSQIRALNWCLFIFFSPPAGCVCCSTLPPRLAIASSNFLKVRQNRIQTNKKTNAQLWLLPHCHATRRLFSFPLLVVNNNNLRYCQHLFHLLLQLQTVRRMSIRRKTFLHFTPFRLFFFGGGGCPPPQSGKNGADWEAALSYVTKVYELKAQWAPGTLWPAKSVSLGTCEAMKNKARMSLVRRW